MWWKNNKTEEVESYGYNDNKEELEGKAYEIIVTFIGDSDYTFSDMSEEEVNKFREWYKDGEDKSSYEFKNSDGITCLRKENILYVEIL